MLTRLFKTYSFPFIVGMAGLTLYAGQANAGVGVCQLKDAARDTGWSITFDDTQVSECVFVGNPAGRNKGTLSLTLKITDRTPISIMFVEGATEQAAQNSFGFRITWNLKLVNQFQDLKGIRGRANDPNPVLDEDQNPNVSDDHPGFAHFHQDASFDPGPFFGAKDCDCESEPNFKIRGATFVAGSTGIVKGIGVHQIEQQNQSRSFTVNVNPLRENKGMGPK